MVPVVELALILMLLLAIYRVVLSGVDWSLAKLIVATVVGVLLLPILIGFLKTALLALIGLASIALLLAVVVRAWR